MHPRREFLQALAGLAAGQVLPAGAKACADEPIRRAIPASGELLPVIGMGTWITFDVGDDARLRAQRREVLRVFFECGGALIDSSPMYGSAEDVVGDLLRQLRGSGRPFAATKVWTPGRWLGIRQMEHSRELWGVARIDLMQIHNLLDWQTHLPTLQAWKAEGRLRYIGITTSHGRRHAELERAIARESFDFVQLSYSVLDREAEERLLPLAAERRMAVIVNRPFRAGELFEGVRGRPLPAWAAEFDCDNWAQYFLKFVVAHPAVTCAIPATSRVDHMRENMGAGYGRLPDPDLRRRMVAHLAAL